MGCSPAAGFATASSLKAPRIRCSIHIRMASPSMRPPPGRPSWRTSEAWSACASATGPLSTDYSRCSAAARRPSARPRACPRAAAWPRAPGVVPAGCRMAELPGDIAPPEPGDGRPDLTGVFDYAPSAAQTLMLEYAEDKKRVGWARASAADLELIGTLHAMKGDLLQRPAPLGAHGATRLARRMLDGVERTDGAKLTVLVGHDTNIGDLSGLLDFDFQVMGYAANT